MQVGISEILKNAPTKDVAKLSNDFKTQTLKASISLQSNLLKQNEKENLSVNLAAQENRTINLFDAGASGDKELSSSITGDIVRSWQLMAESGQISKTDSEKGIKAALSSERVANLTGKAFKAEAEGNYQQFIAEASNNVPDGVGIQEHIDNVSKVMSVIQAKRNHSAELRQGILSTGKY
jgi:hypothetical protein